MRSLELDAEAATGLRHGGGALGLHRRRSPERGGLAAAPVTITLGNPDTSGSPRDTQDITYFARQVHQLSGGQMNIRILWLVTQADNWEQATVRW